MKKRYFDPSLCQQNLPIYPESILELLHDCERMVLACIPAITASSSQVYSSALVFTPSSSVLRATYEPLLIEAAQVRVGIPKSRSANVTTLYGHTDYVNCIAYSKKGADRIASASSDCTIRLWDGRTGVQLHVLESDDRVRSVAFSPSGKEILSGSGGGMVDLWDATSGARIASRKAHTHNVRAVAFSPSGRFVASASDDKTVALWDLHSEEFAPVHVFSGHGHFVRSVAFSSDGTLLVSGSWDMTCKIWTIEHPSKTPHTLRHSSFVHTVSISPDDTTIACGCDDGAVYLWAKEGTEPARVLRSPGRCVNGLEFFPDARCTLATSSDSLIRLWDLTTGECIGETKEGSLGTCFSPDGSHLITSSGNTVRIWECSLLKINVASGGRELVAYSGGISGVATISFSPHGDVLATISSDGIVRTWDVRTCTQLRAMAPITVLSSGGFVVWSPDGSFLLSCGAGHYSLLLWDAALGERVSVFEHKWRVEAAAFSHDGRTIIASSWDTVHCIDISSGADSVLYKGSGPVTAFAVAHHAPYVLSATLDYAPLPGTAPDTAAGAKCSWLDYRGYPVVRLHNFASRETLWSGSHTSPLDRLAFSADDARAAGTHYRSSAVSLWALQVDGAQDDSGDLACPMRALGALDRGAWEHDEAVAFSADGTAIVTKTSYTPLPAHLSAGDSNAVRDVSPPPSPSYYLSDGWIWRGGPGAVRRRLCWVPPGHRNNGAANREGDRGSMEVRCHLVAFATPHRRLVVIDLSSCSVSQ